MWRLALAILLLGVAILGMGFEFGQANHARNFITAPVERGAVASFVSATGTLEAQTTVYISSQLSGQIAEVYVDFNDVVKAGQPLARLDQESLLAQVNEARADLKMATATVNLQQATVERAKLTVITARSEQRLAEAQAAAAQARQKETEKELERKTKLARTGSGSERDLSQALAVRDTGAADLRAILEQVQIKEQAIQIAEADVRIAEATGLWQKCHHSRSQVALWSYEDNPIGGLNHACLDCLRPHHFGCGRTWRLLSPRSSSDAAASKAWVD